MVTAPGGAPLSGIHVATLKWNDDLDLWATADSDTTGADGSYMVGKLESGTYRVRYYDPTGAYATEFYNDKSRAIEAEPIDVSKGKLTLEPAVLGGAAHMTGRVTGTGGVAVPGAEITAYVMQDGAWVQFQSVVAGEDGSYDLGGLPGGGYTLGFVDPVSGVGEYWNNQPELATASAIQLAELRHEHRPGRRAGDPGRPADADRDADADADHADPATSGGTTGSTTTTTTTTTTTAPAPAAPSAVRAVAVVKMPKIKGFAKVDQRLRVTKGAWNPTSVKRKVQWMANGKKIKGATKMRLRLTKQAGRQEDHRQGHGLRRGHDDADRPDGTDQEGQALTR